jgi:hypothetical protein
MPTAPSSGVRPRKPKSRLSLARYVYRSYRRNGYSRFRALRLAWFFANV